MATLHQAHWWPGAVVGTLGLAVAVTVDGALLAAGGLAPIAVAAGIAALVGVMVARVEWRAPLGAEDRYSASARALGPTLAVCWIAAAWTSRWPDLGGGLAGATLWALAVVAVRLRGELAVVGLALLCGCQMLLSAAVGWIEAPPWTLLEPGWSEVAQWLPWSLMAGLLLGGAGLGHWSRRPTSAPGTARVPWLAVGAVLLVVLASASQTGSRLEQHLDLVPDLMGQVGSALAILAAAASFLVVTPRTIGLRAAAMGGLAMLWFAGPGAGGREWFLAGWLPLGMALILGHSAYRRRGGERAVMAAGCVCVTLATAIGWPGVADHPTHAVAAALTGVALFWIAGTMGVREAR